jgi:hypothetical protein
MEIFSFIAINKLIPARIRNRTAFRSPEDYVAAYKKARERRAKAVALKSGGEGSDSRGQLRMFHPVLGWDYPPGVEYKDANGVAYAHGLMGERRTCTSFATNLISTYGDSFTYCSDVADCQTWQTYLGEKIRANVVNFGVAGYGTDQAYLKYELNAAGGYTPVVMLCILPDDINRVVNVFRTFYAPEDLLALTKPRYVPKGSNFELASNPLSRPQDATRLEDASFVKKLGETDYWYEKDLNRPRLGFPYLFSLISWRQPLAQYVTFNLGLARKGSGTPFYPNNLFNEPEPLAIMCHITDLFVQTATARKSRPVMVLMPHKELIIETLKHGATRIEPLVEYLRLKQYLFIDLIRTMAEMHPTPDQLDNWYHEHATPDGNRITAEILAQYLEREKLLPENTKLGSEK